MNSMTLISPLPPESIRPAFHKRDQDAAHQFESSLIASFLESLQRTFANLPGESNLPGADEYSYLGTQALAEGITARGGFGISGLIAKYLSAHESKRQEVPNDGPGKSRTP